MIDSGRKDCCGLKDILVLQKSFEDFNRATARLQRAFSRLEQKYDCINQELECRNNELQKALSEKEEVRNYLHNILESLSTGIVVIDSKGTIIMMNRHAESFAGISRSCAEGQKFREVFEGMSALDNETLLPNESQTLEEKITFNGRTVRLYASPVQTKDEPETGTVVLLQDITRIEALEEIAQRRDKLIAMGEMAASIAHEMRNPLGSIELFASLILRDDGNADNRERAAHIISAVRNMDNKIANLLLFANKNNLFLKKVHLVPILEEVVLFCQQIVEGEGIFLKVENQGEDPVVEGDGEFLKQAFLNILLNAFQAMPNGGEILIETAPHAGITGLKSSKALKIRFQDTGIGISDQDRKKIFDPFFTTKEGSTGLGLAIVHTIIDMHGGSLEVESRFGAGTAVTIVLPCLQQRVEL